MRLSEILQQQIQDLDEDYEEWEGPIDPQDPRAYEKIRQLEIDAVEGFLPAKLTEVLVVSPKTGRLSEGSLDDSYSRVLVREIPRVVERAPETRPRLDHTGTE